VAADSLAFGDFVIVYYGHHKCASQWVLTHFEAAAWDLGLRFARLPDPELSGASLLNFLARSQIDVLAIENARASHAQALAHWKGVHVVRDPRDIVVSGYFSHLKTHRQEALGPTVRAHRERLNQLPKAEGLHEEIDLNRHWFEHFMAWNFRQPNVLELRFEELTTDPYNGFLNAFQFVGLLQDPTPSWEHLIRAYNRSRGQIRGGRRLPPWRLRGLPPERCLAIVYRNRFEALSGGRRQGSEDTGSHYRKGVAGDWKNHLNSEHLAHFERSYPGLLGHLGYGP
jgi:hypothetical protein